MQLALGGIHGGRLLFSRNGKGMLMSDDSGESWRLGKALPASGESQAVQLRNGSVIMQMRNKDHQYSYRWCRSDDGGSSFVSPCLTRARPLVPDVPTSIIRRGSALLLSHPNSATLPCPLGRKNMTLSASHDEGGTWADELTVHAGPSGYSSLAWLPAGGKAWLLGLLYEKSSDGKEPIDFQEVELAIISGAGAVA